MTALDIRARATGLRLLEKYGKPCTISRIIEGAYDPATGNISAESVVTSTPFALIEDYSGILQSSEGIALISGMIEKTDRKVTIPAKGQDEPAPNDRLSIDGVTYSVISVGVVWSGEQAALYVMQVRK